MAALRFTLAVIVAALIVTGCGGPSEADVRATVQAEAQATAQASTQAGATQEAESACGKAKLNAYADALAEKMQAFDQQRQLVSTTPRASIGTPLQRLLDIQSETRKIEVPKCLEEYQARVLATMMAYQQAYQNFAAQGDDLTTQAWLLVADQEWASIRKASNDVRAGKVPPTETPRPPTPTK